MIDFDFECEGCHSQGRLQVNESEAYKPFGCPEGCGATYIMWKPPRGKWTLKCVVCPVFEDDLAKALAGQEQEGKK